MAFPGDFAVHNDADILIFVDTGCCSNDWWKSDLNDEEILEKLLPLNLERGSRDGK
ncbi:MAG: hypothetical protein ABIU06_20915 [Anaerolineales bacterium]